MVARLRAVLVVAVWAIGAAVSIWQVVDWFLAEEQQPVFPFFGLSYLTVGAFVVLRRPREQMAWLFFAFGALMASAPLWGDFGVLLFGLLFAGGAGLLLLFPNGRLPSPRWRPLAWVLIGSWTVASLGEEPMALALALAVLASMVAALSPIWRYRSAGLMVRAQLRWLAWAVAVGSTSALPAIAIGGFASDASKSGALGLVQLVAALGALLVAAVGVPLAIAVAILRYRLYEIDRIVSRTVSYALVAGLLAAVYAVGVLGLGSLVRRGSPLVVASSTLAAAALFNPLRLRLQSAVDHRFNRTRYNAERVVNEFSQHLRDHVNLDEIIRGLSGVLSQTLQPTSATLWLKEAR